MTDDSDPTTIPYLLSSLLEEVAMRAEDSLRAMEQENNINKAEQQHEENEEKSLRTGKKTSSKVPSGRGRRL